MQTKIIILFFILLSILLISVTLLFTAKPIYLVKVEKDRVAKVQKNYYKSYFRKRNIHIPLRSIRVAQKEIDTILIETPIQFKYKSYSLEDNKSRDNFIILNKMIDILNNLKDKAILQIETHTDSKGSKRDNLKLSQKRADSLKSFIKSRSKIVFISAIGYGEEIKNKKKSNKKYLDINLKRIK